MKNTVIEKYLNMVYRKKGESKMILEIEGTARAIGNHENMNGETWLYTYKIDSLPKGRCLSKTMEFPTGKIKYVLYSGKKEA